MIDPTCRVEKRGGMFLGHCTNPDPKGKGEAEPVPKAENVRRRCRIGGSARPARQGERWMARTPQRRRVLLALTVERLYSVTVLVLQRELRRLERLKAL